MLEREMGRDGGYHFVRLLEQEVALYDELTLRRKRLMEYQWREDRNNVAQRGTYLMNIPVFIPKARSLVFLNLKPKKK